MATLTGQSIASSYEQLLHVDRDGGGNGTTLVNIKDGDNGTTFALQMATDKIQVNGNATISGDVNNPSSSLLIPDSPLSSVICFAFIYLGMAAVASLNNQPFFNPICAIRS